MRTLLEAIPNSLNRVSRGEGDLIFFLNFLYRHPSLQHMRRNDSNNKNEVNIFFLSNLFLILESYLEGSTLCKRKIGENLSSMFLSWTLTRHSALPVGPGFSRELASSSNPIAAGSVITSLPFREFIFCIVSEFLI